MNDMNYVLLIGRLTRDCVLESAAGTGRSYMKYTFAVNHDKKNLEGTYDTVPDFFNSVIYDTYAENLVKYMKKGTLIAVAAKLGTRREEEGAYPVIILKTFSIQILDNLGRKIHEGTDLAAAPAPGEVAKEETV